MSSNTNNLINLPSLSNLSKNSTSSQEKFLGISRRHKCSRCRHFHGSCKCTRRKFNYYKHRRGCMCNMIIKGTLVVLAIYLISRLMQSVDEKNMFKFN